MPRLRYRHPEVPIPCRPRAHYSCGGVQVDVWGKTSSQVPVRGRRSGRERVFTGPTGLLPRRCSKDLSGVYARQRDTSRDTSTATNPTRKSDIPPWQFPERVEEVDPALIHQDWVSIKSTMWNYVGIIRTRGRLERGLGRHRVPEEPHRRFLPQGPNSFPWSSTCATGPHRPDRRRSGPRTT